MEDLVSEIIFSPLINKADIFFLVEKNNNYSGYLW